MELFTLDQVVQLRDIERARVRSGGNGFRGELQELIHRLESGGVAPGQPGGKPGKGKKGAPDRHHIVLQQAKVLWNKGWGPELGIVSFGQYLETIPDIPAHLLPNNPCLPYLTLVDRRIALTTMCRLLNVKYAGTDATFVPHDETNAISTPVYWVRMQDGKACRNRCPSDCRTAFASQGEVGLEAHEGLALFAQHPEALELGSVWDLTGSVHANNRGYDAYLRRLMGDDVILNWWDWKNTALPNCGSVSRGSV